MFVTRACSGQTVSSRLQVLKFSKSFRCICSCHELRDVSSPTLKNQKQYQERLYFYLSENTVDQFPYTNLLSNFRHF